MVSKRDLLEEKTVKELRKMAKDKSISGYSGKKKSELVDMIADNYTKEEIEGASETEKDTQSGEEKNTSAPAGDELKSRPIVIGLVLVLIPSLIGLGLFFYFGGDGGSSPAVGEASVTTDNYSFSYPADWTVTKTGAGSYRVSENVPENKKNALVQVSVTDLVRGGVENVGGETCLEFVYEQTGYYSRTLSGLAARKGRQVFLPENNKIYMVAVKSLENVYDNYKSDFDTIMNSFTFSEENFSASENEGIENYENDEQSLYFNYPAGWAYQTPPQTGLLIYIIENISEGSPNALGRIQMFDLDSIVSRVVDGHQGVEIINTNVGRSGQKSKTKTALTVKDDKLYTIDVSAPDNLYDNYKPQFNTVFDSFTFSE